MREILFRGKGNPKYNDGGWYEGYLTHDTEDYQIYTPIGIRSHCTTTIIEETIGQYTGLTDKNGKKIFEGDIICIPFAEDAEYGEHTYYEYGVVYFDEKYLAWCVKFDDGETMFLEEYDDCATVTGNIHDNPELLKGE